MSDFITQFESTSLDWFRTEETESLFSSSLTSLWKKEEREKSGAIVLPPHLHFQSRNVDEVQLSPFF